MERENETKYWVAFHQAPYIGPVRLERLRRHFGGLAQAWNADARALAAVLDARAVESLLRTRRALNPDRELERIIQGGIEAISIEDPRYPRLLREISAPPPVLYVRGELTSADETAVAIVGTRRATATGREIAARLGEDLAAAGVTIVSGLARGIDGAAHQAALRADGRTIAVLGSGPDVIYPPEHRLLAERIVERGAVLSDYPPGRKPDAMNFPARNRIISGLSLGVVLVEAPAKSGALITADFAADQGREVFVAPGGMLAAASAGSNALLRDGARAIGCANDVLDDLRIGSARPEPIQQLLPLDGDAGRLLALLSLEPTHIDDLAAAAGLDIAQAGALLMMLQLDGRVRDAGANHYIRSR
ncbi:MAG TPA: DNA-processing protein DprA [Thermomicrobiales bacterium]|jgi:DNA processing protein|nr:DNA-processing protein DprA [Thermomicrobiales bacterium]